MQFLKDLLRAQWEAFDELVNALTPMGRLIMAMAIAYAMTFSIIFTIDSLLPR